MQKTITHHSHYSRLLTIVVDFLILGGLTLLRLRLRLRWLLLLLLWWGLQVHWLCVVMGKRLRVQ